MNMDDGWERRMAARAHKGVDERARERYIAEAAEAGIPVHQSADEVWAAFPGECRDCSEPKPPPPGAHYGWIMWSKCGGPPRCSHKHHADDILIG